MDSRSFSLPKCSVGDTIPVAPRKPLPLEDLPTWENLPYDTKYPLSECSEKISSFSREELGKSLYQTYPRKEFDLRSPSAPILESYDPLHDPHLRSFFQSSFRYQTLVKKGLITKDGKVKSRLKEYNQYRMYLYSIWAMQVNQLRRTQLSQEEECFEKILESLDSEDPLLSDITEKYEEVNIEQILEDAASKIFQDKKIIAEHGFSPFLRSVFQWKMYQESLRKDFKNNYPAVKQWLYDQTKFFRNIMERKINKQKKRNEKILSRWERICKSNRARYEKEQSLREMERERRRALCEQHYNRNKRLWAKNERELKMRSKNDKNFLENLLSSSSVEQRKWKYLEPGTVPSKEDSDKKVKSTELSEEDLPSISNETDSFCTYSPSSSNSETDYEKQKSSIYGMVDNNIVSRNLPETLFADAHHTATNDLSESNELKFATQDAFSQSYRAFNSDVIEKISADDSQIDPWEQVAKLSDNEKESAVPKGTDDVPPLEMKKVSEFLNRKKSHWKGFQYSDLSPESGKDELEIAFLNNEEQVRKKDSERIKESPKVTKRKSSSWEAQKNLLTGCGKGVLGITEVPESDQEKKTEGQITAYSPSSKSGTDYEKQKSPVDGIDEEKVVSRNIPVTLLEDKRATVTDELADIHKTQSTKSTEQDASNYRTFDSNVVKKISEHPQTDHLKQIAKLFHGEFPTLEETDDFLPLEIKKISEYLPRKKLHSDELKFLDSLPVSGKDALDVTFVTNNEEQENDKISEKIKDSQKITQRKSRTLEDQKNLLTRCGKSVLRIPEIPESDQERKTEGEITAYSPSISKSEIDYEKRKFPIDGIDGEKVVSRELPKTFADTKEAAATDLSEINEVSSTKSPKQDALSQTYRAFNSEVVKKISVDDSQAEQWEQIAKLSDNENESTVPKGTDDVPPLEMKKASEFLPRKKLYWEGLQQSDRISECGKDAIEITFVSSNEEQENDKVSEEIKETSQPLPRKKSSSRETHRPLLRKSEEKVLKTSEKQESETEEQITALDKRILSKEASQKDSSPSVLEKQTEKDRSARYMADRSLQRRRVRFDKNPTVYTYDEKHPTVCSTDSETKSLDERKTVSTDNTEELLQVKELTPSVGLHDQLKLMKFLYGLPERHEISMEETDVKERLPKKDEGSVFDKQRIDKTETSNAFQPYSTRTGLSELLHESENHSCFWDELEKDLIAKKRKYHEFLGLETKNLLKEKDKKLWGEFCKSDLASSSICSHDKNQVAFDEHPTVIPFDEEEPARVCRTDSEYDLSDEESKEEILERLFHKKRFYRRLDTVFIKDNYKIKKLQAQQRKIEALTSGSDKQPYSKHEIPTIFRPECLKSKIYKSRRDKLNAEFQELSGEISLRKHHLNSKFKKSPKKHVPQTFEESTHHSNSYNKYKAKCTLKLPLESEHLFAPFPSTTNKWERENTNYETSESGPQNVSSDELQDTKIAEPYSTDEKITDNEKLPDKEKYLWSLVDGIITEAETSRARPTEDLLKHDEPDREMDSNKTISDVQDKSKIYAIKEYVHEEPKVKSDFIKDLQERVKEEDSNESDYRLVKAVEAVEEIASDKTDIRSPLDSQDSAILNVGGKPSTAIKSKEIRTSDMNTEKYKESATVKDTSEGIETDIQQNKHYDSLEKFHNQEKEKHDSLQYHKYEEMLPNVTELCEDDTTEESTTKALSIINNETSDYLSQKQAEKNLSFAILELLQNLVEEVAENIQKTSEMEQDTTDVKESKIFFENQHKKKVAQALECQNEKEDLKSDTFAMIDSFNMIPETFPSNAINFLYGSTDQLNLEPKSSISEYQYYCAKAPEYFGYYKSEVYSQKQLDSSSSDSTDLHKITKLQDETLIPPSDIKAIDTSDESEQVIDFQPTKVVSNISRKYADTNNFNTKPIDKLELPLTPCPEYIVLREEIKLDTARQNYSDIKNTQSAKFSYFELEPGKETLESVTSFIFQKPYGYNGYVKYDSEYTNKLKSLLTRYHQSVIIKEIHAYSHDSENMLDKAATLKDKVTFDEITSLKGEVEDISKVKSHKLNLTSVTFEPLDLPDFKVLSPVITENVLQDVESQSNECEISTPMHWHKLEMRDANNSDMQDGEANNACTELSTVNKDKISNYTESDDDTYVKHTVFESDGNMLKNESFLLNKRDQTDFFGAFNTAKPSDQRVNIENQGHISTAGTLPKYSSISTEEQFSPKHTTLERLDTTNKQKHKKARKKNSFMRKIIDPFTKRSGVESSNRSLESPLHKNKSFIITEDTEDIKTFSRFPIHNDQENQQDYTTSNIERINQSTELITNETLDNHDNRENNFESSSLDSECNYEHFPLENTKLKDHGACSNIYKAEANNAQIRNLVNQNSKHLEDYFKTNQAKSKFTDVTDLAIVSKNDDQITVVYKDESPN